MMSWSPSLPCCPWGRNLLIPVCGGVGFGLTTCRDDAAVGMRGKKTAAWSLSEIRNYNAFYYLQGGSWIYSSSLQGLSVHSNLIFADLVSLKGV